MAKRIFDVAASLLAVPFLLPVFLALGIWIKLDSPGPILYRGLRAGKNGTAFHVLKFRTMVPEAEQLGSGTTALNDFRLTRVGTIIRNYKLDELPQVLNVIKGDMSLVGPRPELLEYAALYEGDEKLILSVRPGITDHSSIKFSALDVLVGEVDANKAFNEKVLPERTALRLKYVRERTFWGDLRLIFRTLRVILAKLA
jgi:lipopolysaccharide/colanic/teichoic acid biosynthesis glycosyltransferase